MQSGLKVAFRFASQGPPTSPKENMTPAGLAPAPVAVFTCSREARRLIKSGLKAVHRSLSGPREVETLGRR